MPQKSVTAGLSLKANNGHVVRKRKQKLTRKSVLKMLAVMEASQNAGPSKTENTTTVPPTPEDGNPHKEDFLQSGRTGRRNALADILGQHASVTSSDLPSKLEALTTNDSKTDVVQKDEPPPGPGTSTS